MPRAKRNIVWSSTTATIAKPRMRTMRGQPKLTNVLPHVEDDYFVPGAALSTRHSMHLITSGQMQKMFDNAASLRSAKFSWLTAYYNDEVQLSVIVPDYAAYRRNYPDSQVIPKGSMVFYINDIRVYEGSGTYMRSIVRPLVLAAVGPVVAHGVNLDDENFFQKVT